MAGDAITPLIEEKVSVAKSSGYRESSTPIAKTFEGYFYDPILGVPLC